jgi:2-amino-4-hydroxy-6-hydroxymethyldihydropteridine diphosphokinase
MPSDVTVYISLGSNLGDRAAHTEQAIRALATAGVRVLRRSSLYETEPVDVSPAPLAAAERVEQPFTVNVHNQPWFLNCAVEAETFLTPHSLLDALLAAERSLGRVRSLPGAARTIDLDILFYGELVLREPGLEIPHPRMAARRFVLAPLAEIAPGLRHPVLGRSVVELLAATSDRSQIRLAR